MEPKHQDSISQSHDQEKSFQRSVYESPDHPLTLDDLISKIGFSYYHAKVYIIVGLMLINDGAESLVLSILQNILKNNDFHLSDSQTNMVGTVIFAGFLFGSLISGKLSDRYGRVKPLAFLTLLLYIFAMGSAFVQGFVSLLIVRAFYGFLVGVQTPICFTYLAEITPKESRGLWLVVAGSWFTLGELMTCACAYFTLDGVSSGNWRLLLICVAQPCILSWLGMLCFLEESPRYLIAVKKDARKAAEILNKIAKQNKKDVKLGEPEIQSLERWVNSQDNLNPEEVAQIKTLFKKDTKWVTIFLWPVWFVLSLTYYGMVYILPQILDVLKTTGLHEESKETLWSVTLPALGEVPSLILALLLIEKGGIGRRGSMVLGFILTATFCFLTAATSDKYFDIWVTAARGILNGVFVIVSPYTTELYPTTVRATGLGMASAFSRIGGSIMPWTTQSLFNIGPKVPFYGFGAFTVFGALCCMCIPYDTTKRELDHDYNKDVWTSVLKKSKGPSVLRAKGSQPQSLLGSKQNEASLLKYQH